VPVLVIFCYFACYFVAKQNFNKTAINAFARTAGIAPGIIVGQLQYKKLLNIKFCNDLKQRFQWTHE
jgi:hypothetical protein